MDYFSTMMWEIEKRGIMALGLHWVVAVPGSPIYKMKAVSDHLAEAEGVSDILDELHLRKIDLADEVLLLAMGGYVGESTSKEIVYAESIGTKITRVINWQECGEYLLILDEMIKEITNVN